MTPAAKRRNRNRKQTGPGLAKEHSRKETGAASQAKAKTGHQGRNTFRLGSAGSWVGALCLLLGYRVGALCSVLGSAPAFESQTGDSTILVKGVPSECQHGNSTNLVEGFPLVSLQPGDSTTLWSLREI